MNQGGRKAVQGFKFIFIDPDLQTGDIPGESLVSAHLGVEFNLKARPRVGITLHAARVKMEVRVSL